MTPYTVGRSFEIYQSDVVDLDANEVARARTSRDYLVGQIKRVGDTDSTFPKLTGEYMSFGSFARRTKVRPLNDVDLLLFLDGNDLSIETIFLANNRYKLKVDYSGIARFRSYMDDYGYLNSTKILNKFKSALVSVPNYRKSEIKRTQVAVVLNLSSYAWSFDIVPAVQVFNRFGGTDHYLIPDGAGAWMRTDPRKDQELVTSVNKQHNGLTLPLLRLIKYWNAKRWSPPSIPSYYLETMLLNRLKQAFPIGITSVKTGIPRAFQYLQSAVLQSCPDPKGLGENLENGVDWETRKKVSESCATMANFADSALGFEKSGDDKTAISLWSLIFPDYPTYG